MELPEILTKVKQKVLKNTHLTDKDKQIVIHILKATFKEIITEEKKAEEAYLKDSNNAREEYSPIGNDAFDNLFGGMFNSKNKK